MADCKALTWTRPWRRVYARQNVRPHPRLSRNGNRALIYEPITTYHTLVDHGERRYHYVLTEEYHGTSVVTALCGRAQFAEPFCGWDPTFSPCGTCYALLPMPALCSDISRPLTAVTP